MSDADVRRDRLFPRPLLLPLIWLIEALCYLPLDAHDERGLKKTIFWTSCHVTNRLILLMTKDKDTILTYVEGIMW